MKGWRRYKLSDVVEIIGGGTPKTKVPEYWNGNIPWLSVVDFNNDQRKVHETDKRITNLGLENSSTKILNKGELIISARGTVGQLAQLGCEMAFNQSCYGLSAKSKISTNDYCYYLIKHSVGNIQQNAHGSVFDTITRNTFENIQVNLPPLPEQKAIASILSAIDDKIELNLQMNKTLEDMAMALYKHWFVDFGPFQDGKFVESELGLIPEGWEVKKLGNVTTELRRGISPKYTESTGVRVVNQRCIRNHIINFSLTRLNDPTKRKVDGRFIELGDVLINSTGVGTLGRMATVLHLEEPTVVDSHVTIVRGDYNIYKLNYFGRAMLSYEKIISSMGLGSTGQTELSRKQLTEISILVPPLKIQNKVETQFENFSKTVSNNILESQTLTQLRDTMLPKLISGEVRLKAFRNTIAKAI